MAMAHAMEKVPGLAHADKDRHAIRLEQTRSLPRAGHEEPTIVPPVCFVNAAGGGRGGAAALGGAAAGGRRRYPTRAEPLPEGGVVYIAGHFRDALLLMPPERWADLARPDPPVLRFFFL